MKKEFWISSRRKSLAGREVNGRIQRKIIAKADDEKFCFVYVICPLLEKRPSKIGIARSPDHRLADLQTSHWMELSVAHRVWVCSRRFAQMAENKTHKLLEMRGLSLKGEWFDLTSDEARDAIEEIVATLAPRAIDRSAEIRMSFR